MAALQRIVLLGSIIVLFFSCLQNTSKSLTEEKLNALSEYLIIEEGLSHIKMNSLHQIFAIKNNNTLKRYDEYGNNEASFQKLRYGFIHDYTVNNNLRYTLFYRDFKKIVILDRYLAEEQLIDLELWGLEDISAVSPSLDKKLWLYDRTNRRLLKYDLNGNAVLSSDDLIFHADISLDVTYIHEYGNIVYLITTDGYVIEMDNLGNYLNTWNVNPVSPPLHQEDNEITFRIRNEVYVRSIESNLGTENLKKIGEIPSKSEFAKIGKLIYILDIQGIYKLSNEDFRQD